MESKRVVIVCNGESVLAKAQGDYIDGFDKVIRIGMYRIDGYEKYVGAKQDIAVVRDWQRIDIPDDVNVWSPPPVLDGEKIASDNILTDLEYLSIKDIIGLDTYIPTTGIVAYFMARKYLPEHEIHYCGLDFLDGGWYWDPSHSHAGVKDESGVQHCPLKEMIWFNDRVRSGDIFQI